MGKGGKAAYHGVPILHGVYFAAGNEAVQHYGFLHHEKTNSDHGQDDKQKTNEQGHERGRILA